MNTQPNLDAPDGAPLDAAENEALWLSFMKGKVAREFETAQRAQRIVSGHTRRNQKFLSIIEARDAEVAALKAQMPVVIVPTQTSQEQFRDEVEIDGVAYGKVGFNRHYGEDFLRISSRRGEKSGVIDIPLEAATAFVALMSYVLSHKTRPDEHSCYAFPPRADIMAQVEKEMNTDAK